MRQDDERYRSLLEQAPFSIQVFAPDGRTIRVNRAFEQLWGVPFDRMNGYNVLEDPQLEAAGTIPYIRRGFAGETVRIPPIQYNPNDSVPGVTDQADPRRWLSAVIFPVTDDAGTIREVVIIHEDITARVLAEQERYRSEQLARSVLESITDAFYAVDRDWRFTYVNPQAEYVVGKAPAELLGKVVWDEYPGLVGSEFERVFRTVHDDRVSSSLTAYYPDHDRWYEVHVYPGSDGGISVYVQNVSERMRAQIELARATEAQHRTDQALRESMRLYQAIGESIDYGVWVCDPEGRNVYCSPSFLRLVGLTQEQCSEFGWGDALHPDDQVRTIELWQECVRTGGEWDIEHRYRGVDGTWHPVLARGVPVRDDRGEITAWAGINLDISRLKQVEVELREADRRKDEFLATLAHELRNPLAPIRNSLEILKMPRIDEAMARQARDMMERQVQHLVRLVDDLLDVSRVMRGKIELKRERVELANVVARAVETCQPLIDVQGHHLEIALAPESMPLDADPVRLAQVIGNLLTNAAKYTEANGRIWLGAKREGGQAVLRVRDSGIGIPEDLLPHVFELFVQGDNAAARAQGGLGVGLTLVRRLVEMHGGTVEATSPGPGRGTEMTVRLPLAVEEPTAAGAVDTSSATGKLRRSSGLRVMVVDDNEDAAVSLAMLLRLQGHDVRVAHDGPSGLELAAHYVPDAIFLDIGMPGMDGYEVARRIRREPCLRGVVLAAVTGWGQAEDRRRTSDAGFDHHLVKPPEPEAIEKLLDDLRRTTRR